MIRKADIILAAVLILLGIGISYALFTGSETGSRVCIFADGTEYASYGLSEDRTVTVSREGHINKITIKDGKVSMSFSDCANQDCIRQGTIGDTSRSIICLPNKIVVEVQGSESAYDTIVR